MMVTLRLQDGQKITFSKVESISAFDESFKSKVAKSPIQGKCFLVDPSTIKQNLFVEERKNQSQEKMRKLILEAFEELKENSRYKRTFKTLIPEKEWSEKTIGELNELASKVGDHITDWVEQALEWAQRISNGETWESICNKADDNDWYRLVKWKHGDYMVVGGSSKKHDDRPFFSIEDNFFYDYTLCIHTVPLVTIYEE